MTGLPAPMTAAIQQHAACTPLIQMPVQVMGRVIQPLVCAHAIAIGLDLPAIHVILDGAELIMDHGSEFGAHKFREMQPIIKPDRKLFL